MPETDFSIPEVNENIPIEMQEEELNEDQAEETDYELKKTNYRVFQEYKDFKTGSAQGSGGTDEDRVD